MIAPVVQAELVEVDELSATDRGAGGFGSTGLRDDRPVEEADPARSLGSQDAMPPCRGRRADDRRSERAVSAADSPPIQVVSVKAQHESGPVAIPMKTPQESGPVAISMKTPMDPDAAAGGPARTPVVKRPKLRAISEITPLPHAPAARTSGNLAPPRDPAEVRSRRVRTS